MLQQYEAEIGALRNQVNSNTHVIEDHKIGQRKEMKELDHAKQRIGELESELEQLKNLENTSPFGTAALSGVSTAKYDYEVGKMRQYFTTKLQKSREEINKCKEAQQRAEEKANIHEARCHEIE